MRKDEGIFGSYPARLSLYSSNVLHLAFLLIILDKLAWDPLPNVVSNILRFYHFQHVNNGAQG